MRLSDRELARRFVYKLVKAYPKNLKKAFFFGSRAMGNANPDSDYDLLIILKVKNNRVINGLYDEVLLFLLKYGIDVSLKIYTEMDFHKEERLSAPFIEEVKKKGVILWSQN